MSPRTRYQQAQTIKPARVGQVDTMSKLAKQTGLPLCEALADGEKCTRAAGHFEGFGKGIERNHPSSTHVAVDHDFITRKVWHP